MTDTPKPLVPLYPYQCPECGGRKRAAVTIGSATWDVDCDNCNRSGMVWLPTPHPAQTLPDSLAIEIFEAYEASNDEEFASWMFKKHRDWKSKPYTKGMIEMNCKNCMHWRINEDDYNAPEDVFYDRHPVTLELIAGAKVRYCKNPNLTFCERPNPDSACLIDGSEYKAWLATGPDFGCVAFKPKE